MDAKNYIGCCGAYCKTCRPFAESACKGCKIGFDSGERDLTRAKCKIKLCCFRDKKLDTCADCPEIMDCNIVGSWYAKRGYKYGQYRQAIEFIVRNGYSKFLKLTSSWKNAYGKLE